MTKKEEKIFKEIQEAYKTLPLLREELGEIDESIENLKKVEEEYRKKKQEFLDRRHRISSQITETLIEIDGMINQSISKK